MLKIRVADFIANFIKKQIKSPIFMIVGGGAMYLNDAFKKQELKYICNHHEQASAIAAEGYARSSGNLAVVSVTSGPGGTNTLTGVAGQWLDSIPVLYISGQVNYNTTIVSVPKSGLRQLGDQEINIIDVVKPITKYAKMITNPETIRAELETAIKIATSDRPGPVWLDIPLNIQGALIEESKLMYNAVCENDRVIKEIPLIVKELKKAKRPALIVGHGVKISKGNEQLLQLVNILKIPVLTTFNGFDLVPSNLEYFVGRIGTLGSRAGNFTLQNADLIVSIGTRNNIRQVSYQSHLYAKNAKKIIVDIDFAELNKKTVKGDILIHSDAKKFIENLLDSLPKDFNANQDWLKWCQKRKEKYPVVLDEYKVEKKDCVHPYHFIEELTTKLNSDAIVVAGNGTACVSLFQAGIVKSGQQMFWNSGCASMGYALPASIGAYFGTKKSIVCITGDGSIQMNLQELQTIKHYNLPIKIFVLNNQGYKSIEQTQASFFNDGFIGCNKKSGVSFPDICKIARAYDILPIVISKSKNLQRQIANVLDYNGPIICEVMLDPKYEFAPKLSAEKMPDGTIVAKSLEDLSPLLERNEFYSNMIIDNEEL